MNTDPLLTLLDHRVISERYFFSRPGRPQHRLVFTSDDGVELCCSYRPCPGARKTLVHYHGNGEIVADYDDGFTADLASCGVNVLMVEYRGYGESGGSSQLGKMLLDVDSVRRQCGLAAQDTIVYGRSVGAIFAVEWAFLAPDLGGLILESGVADPHQRLTMRLTPEELGTTPETLKAACDKFLDHGKKLAEFRGPLLVLHAAQDSLVEPSHAHVHMSYCPSENKRLVLFSRGDHNTILAANRDEYLQVLRDFLQSILD